MDTIPADLLHQATVSTSTAVSDDKQFELMHVTANPAVVEMLQGLDKLVNSRHLPRLQDWLKTFVKVSLLL